MIITNAEELKNASFLEGVTLLVDKPKNWTSYDVVNKIKFALRKKLQVRKIKVGHAGTLDPLATGLLIIAIGRDTKKLEEFQGLDKKYSGSMKLGETTISYDSEFEPDAFYDTSHITPELIEKKRKQFLGEIEQVPPVFSALKVDGRRAYKSARKGKHVELRPRRVSIIDFQFSDVSIPNIQFNVSCSKGTYIRSLAHDFGRALQSGAFLSSLRRTDIGPYSVDKAFSMDQLMEGFF